MIRVIDGFHSDDVGDWVAELSCLHHQHVRHCPPFQERPWVVTSAGRAASLGAKIDCPLCDRAEPPTGLRTVRVAGPFDADTLPAGLRKTHRVADRTWGVLRIIEGSVGIYIETNPVIVRRLSGGDRQPIPPLVPHRLTVDAPVTLAVDFLVKDDEPSSTSRGLGN
ncbi:MAG: DUF3565 domain-containing protein [Acidimicrobiales bacterium]